MIGTAHFIPPEEAGTYTIGIIFIISLDSVRLAPKQPNIQAL
jgi:hypothetical protein